MILNEEEIEKLRKIVISDDRLEEKAYILYVAYRLYQRTYPFAKDRVGYTWFDAWLFKDMFEKEERFSDENLEWIRRQLLKYEKQIKDLGLDYKKLEVKISKKAIYSKRILENSRFVSLTVNISKETRITSKYRLFDQRYRHKDYIILSREEGITILRKLNLIRGGSIPEDINIKVIYGRKEALKILETIQSKT